LFVPQLTLDYDIKECFSRPFKKLKESCEFYGAREEANDEFKRVIDKLAKTNTEFFAFDQNDVFCSGKKCSAIFDGMPLLRDQIHLSEYGSIEVVKIFERWAVTHAPDLLR
jgi:hypothetical protein